MAEMERLNVSMRKMLGPKSRSANGMNHGQESGGLTISNRKSISAGTQEEGLDYVGCAAKRNVEHYWRYLRGAEPQA